MQLKHDDAAEPEPERFFSIRTSWNQNWLLLTYRELISAEHEQLICFSSFNIRTIFYRLHFVRARDVQWALSDRGRRRSKRLSSGESKFTNRLKADFCLSEHEWISRSVVCVWSGFIRSFINQPQRANLSPHSITLCWLALPLVLFLIMFFNYSSHYPDFLFLAVNRYICLLLLSLLLSLVTQIKREIFSQRNEIMNMFPLSVHFDDQLWSGRWIHSEQS